MTETERVAIVDKDWNNVLVSVVQCTDDPTKNGIVAVNADWTNIWS